MRYVTEYLSYIRGFSRNAKLYLWACFFQSVAMGTVFVVFNLYLLRVGLNESFLGMLVFYSSFAGTVFALPAGRASDRFGRRRALLVSGVVSLAGTLVQVVHPVPWLLVPATIVTGAAWIITAVSGGPFLVETSRDEERPHLFGFSAALITGSSLIGSNLGGLLPKLFAGLTGAGPDSVGPLRATLLVGLVLMAVSVLPLLPMREERREAVPVRTAGSTWLNLSNAPLAFKLALPQVLIGFGAGFIMPLQNVFMDRYLGASPTEIGLIFSAQSLLMGAVSLIAPFLANRWGKVRAITASQGLSMPFLAVMGLAPSLWVYGAASLVRATLMNLANPLIGNFTMEAVDPHERATVSSLINMGWNLGWAVCGWAGGWMMQNVSYTLPYAFTFVLYSVSIALFYRYFKSWDPPLARAVGRGGRAAMVGGTARPAGRDETAPAGPGQ